MEKGSILIHIPHSSTFIPKTERDRIILSDRALEYELLLMTDRYTDDLFDIEGCERHINTISRLVMDPERFRDDASEEMSRCGMGVIYTKTAFGAPLKSISPEDREDIIRQYYDPYHARFTEKVEAILARNDSCLIIDAHSFPSKPLPYESDQAPDRPDICLGYTDFHADQVLVANIKGLFETAGLSVALNRPFSGSIVPGCHYMKDTRVQSMMIELNRALYMDETTGMKNSSYTAIKDLIKRVFR